MTVPQVRLASMDFTHIEYLSEKEKKQHGGDVVTIGGSDDLKNFNDLGIPIINKDSK